MSKHDEVRAQIIAAQAEREAKAMALGPARRKPRSNWAASPPVEPSRRWGRRGAMPAKKV
jgi:hypothetical protein